MVEERFKELFVNVRISAVAEAKHAVCMQQQQMKEWVPKPVHAATTSEGMGSKTRNLHNAAVTMQVSA